MKPVKFTKQTSSPMDNNRSPKSQHNVWRHAQRQVTLNMKQQSGLNSNTQDIMPGLSANVCNVSHAKKKEQDHVTPQG